MTADSTDFITSWRHVGNDDIKNKSLVHQTISGDQVCVTYDPPGESDVTEGVVPVSAQCICSWNLQANCVCSNFSFTCT